MRLPGDRKKEELLKEMIRVNHAGEYGAKRIYQGQMSILSDPNTLEIVQKMADQEQTHLLFFENEMVKRKVRPSILMPFWHIAGYALGVITAKMGSKAAMKCTEAVESVIDEHYSKQIALLNEQDKDLKNTIIKFREEEIEHKDTAIKYGSSGSEYQLLEMIIKGGCKLAINLAKKI